MSKGLKALESLRKECKATYFNENGQQWWTTDKSKDYRCNIIEKELKALQIIKKKDVDFYSLRRCKSVEEYNTKFAIDEYQNLTQEEFTILKEVFGYE